MTTGNIPALNDDNQRSAPTDTNQPQGQGGDQGQQQPQPEQDADELLLQSLTATAKAEEAGTGDGQQQDSGGVKDPASGNQPNGQQGQQQTPIGQQQQPAGDGPMIPKQRLDQVLSERDQQREQNAFLRGQVEALMRQPGQHQPGQQQQQQQAPTTEQQIAEIHAKQDALAKRFDDGELTMADFTRDQRALDAQVATLREGQLAAKFKPAQTAQPQNNSDPLYLDTLTEKLEKDHPWVTTFSEFADKSGNDAEWDYITATAKSNLASRGVDLRKGGDIAKYQLRKEIAELADQFGPSLLGERAKALGITVPGTQQAPNGQQKPAPLSPQAAARKAGLEKASNAPPNLAALTGSTGDATDALSDDRVEALSEEDFDKLPTATRNRLLGISP